MKIIARIYYALNKFRWWLTRPLTLGVRLILMKDQSVLLVKHSYQNQLWFLVGGGVDKNETLEQAARREAHEELGAQLGQLSLFGVYTNFFDFKSDHVVVFVCDDFKLGNKTSSEIEAYQFFLLDALPENIAAGHKRRLDEYLKRGNGLRHGMW